MSKATIVSIQVETGDTGALYATSEQMREVFVSGETLDELKEAIPVVIEAIFDAKGERVQVMEATSPFCGEQFPFVIVPTNSEA